MKGMIAQNAASGRKVTGFTLIEIMIVVVILGVLASIAYPSYRRHALDAKRAEAKAVLSDVAAREEKYFFVCGKYTSNFAGNLTDACTAATSGLGLVTGATVTTMRSSGDNYNTAIALANANATYTITATAIGGQAQDTDCATLSITQTGERNATGANPTRCWTK
jgi:type IV pilus assembly protein PilE